MSKRPSIDLLVYKVVSFDSETFEKDALSHYRECLFMKFNKDGIKITHIPEGFNFKTKELNFFKSKSYKIDYFLYPLIFIYDHVRIFLLFISILLKHKVKVAIVENTYVAVIVGLLRQAGFIKKFIYIPGDWLADKQRKCSLRSYIGSNVIFTFFDYCSCKWSDLVVNATIEICDGRKKFWGKQIAKKEIIFPYLVEIKTTKKIHGFNNSILFLGNIKRDSGLDIVVGALKSLRKEIDVKLKIVGQFNPETDHLRAQSIKYGVENFVEFLGYVERDEFQGIFSDVFCGINLITTKASYTSSTLPAKVYDYLQFLIPVIVTRNVGPIYEIIKQKDLGIVIDPNEDDFVKACLSIFNSQKRFQGNIVTYFNSLNKNSVEKLINNL